MAHISRLLSRRGILAGTLGVTGAALVEPLMARGERSRPHRKVELFLSRESRSGYAIHHASDATQVEAHAAAELSSYLEQITGASYPISSGPTPPAGPCILVGRGAAATSGLTIDFTQLGEDGFALRTTPAGTIVVAGAIPRGTLYGVYWILDRLCGVRWYSMSHTVVPTNPTLSLDSDDLNQDQVPRFDFRQLMSGSAGDPAFRQRNLLNGGRTDGAGWTGALPVPAAIDTWSTYWPVRSYGATYKTLVPDPALEAGGQLQMMNNATRQMAADNLITVLNQRISEGKDASYGFVQNDVLWSPDVDSRNFADAHGGVLSAPVIDMTNDVLARVRATIPTARLSAQAYRFSFDPPTGIAPHPDIVMTVAPYHADFGRSLFSSQNAQIRDGLTSWLSLSPNVLVWTYLTNFRSVISPFPDWFVAPESLKTLATHTSARGYMGQSANGTPGSEMASLRFWVLSRLLWDPNQDVRLLISEFCNGFFGAAGPYVLQYFDLLAASFANSGARLTPSDSTQVAYFPWSAMKAADELLATAQQAVAGDPVFSSHLRVARLGVDYIILIRRAEYVAAAASENVTWDVDTTARIARFDAAVDESGLTKNAGAYITPTELKAQVRIERGVATPPAATAGLPADQWVDFQDLEMKLHLPVTTLVPDPAASDGYAVRMPGSRPDWGVQVALAKLPLEGVWKLYATVRVDGAGAPAASKAITVGTYPPIENTVDYDIAEIGDNQYHEIEIPGTHQYTDDITYAYVAPPASAAVAHVYVDRFFAIRVTP